MKKSGVLMLAGALALAVGGCNIKSGTSVGDSTNNTMTVPSAPQADSQKQEQAREQDPEWFFIYDGRD